MASQETSRRDTGLQIQVLTEEMKISQVFRFQMEERKPGWKKRGRRRESGVKGVALQTSPAIPRYPGVTGCYPGPPWNRRLELGPTRNQTRTESEFKPETRTEQSWNPRSAKQKWSASYPQLRLRPFNQILASRTGPGGGEGPGRGPRPDRISPHGGRCLGIPSASTVSS